MHEDQKRKKTDDLTAFFTLLGSARVKAVRRTLMKLSPGILCIFSAGKKGVAINLTGLENLSIFI